MQLIIDRIEGNIAICEMEDRGIIEISLEELPQGAHEGSVLQYDGTSYTMDLDAENERRARIQRKMEELFED